MPAPLFGTPFDQTVESTTSGHQMRADVAVLADGSHVIVWDTENKDASGSAVVFAIFGPTGAQTSFEVQVNGTTTGNQERPSVTALTDGGFVVTWETPNDGSSAGIYARQYDSTGTALGTEFRVNSTTASTQMHSDVTGLTDGGYVVTWQSFAQDGSDYGIYGQRYDDSGTPQGAEFKVNTYTAFEQVDSSVAALNGGGFVVTWSSRLQDGDDWGVFGQRYDAAGNPTGAEFRVNTTTAGPQQFCEVAGLAGGGFVAVWEGVDVSGTGIFAQRYTAAGTKIGVEILVNADTQFDQSTAHVTGLADGGFVVTWASPDEDQLGAFAQRFDTNGQPVGEQFRLNSGTMSWQFDAAVAGYADGGFVAAWQSFGQDGDGYGIYQQNFHAAEDGFGTDQQDRMLGTSDNDYLSGLNTDDDLYGYSGDDVLNGGAGSDRLIGSSGWDEASYEQATAAVSINLLINNHFGDAAGDTFSSIEQFRLSAYNDRFIGAAADDTVFGQAGDDQLTGGKGADYLDGGAGSDVLQGGKGGDVLIGGTGWDEASYAQDAVQVTVDLAGGSNGGTAAGDVYQSIEQFTLSQLNDVFIGAGGNDTVYGAGGNDQLTGGGGTNYLDGGTGDDILNSGLGVDQLIGGQGTDEVRYTAASAAVTLNVATGTHGGQAAGDELVSIERYRLSTFNDTFTGSGAAELVYGDIGNDAINGGGGNDDLRGEAGNDSIDGGTGADAMAGGIGNDSYVVDAAGDVVTELNGEGTDSVQSSVTFSLAGRYIENLTLTGASAINGTGNSLDNVITGNGAANSLSGADGNDSLNGGGGIDSMSGGIGNDTYIVDNSADVVSEASGAGTDTVQSSASFSLAGQYADNLVLTGAGAINGSGNSLANTITGNSAANSLNGVDGADSLYGKGGNDTLNGGTGTDSFYFDTAIGAGNVDTIQSYSVADDTIMLDRTIFSGIGADGTLALGAFVTGAAAADAADRIVYDSATGKIFYDADGNGAGAAVLFAQVAAGTALTNLDFVAYSG